MLGDRSLEEQEMKQEVTATDAAHDPLDAVRRERDVLAERLRAAFEQSPVSTVVYDADGHVVATNPAFERLWGAAFADVPPDYSVLTDPQLDAAGVLPDLRRAFDGEAVTLPALRYEMESAVGRGRVLWTQAHLYPVRDAAGAVEQVVLTHQDVTARIEAEAARAADSARAERLQALSAALSMASTPDEVAQAVVARAAAVLGAVGMVIARLTPDGTCLEIMRVGAMPEDVHEAWRRFPVTAPVPLAEVARTGEPLFLESRDAWGARYPEMTPLLALTGHHANAVVPLVVEGRVLGTLGAAFDAVHPFDDPERALTLAVAQQCAQALERARLLEAERAARAEAQAAETRLRDVFEQAPVAVAVLAGPEHVYAVVSPRYARSPGGNRPLIGRAIREAFPELAGTGYLEAMDRVYETGEPFYAAERKVRITTDEGTEERYFNIGYSPLRDAAGHVYAIASATYDVTDQVAARREVELARAEAEAANQAKGQFLAVMAHELRTPLNAIGGHAELLEMGIRGPVTPQQAEDLRRIQTSQRHLLGLINEVLNYAKLETGTVQYDLADVVARDALVAAEALVAPQARAKGLALRVVDAAPSLVVRADAEKLRQVLVNLLSNAVKFTDRGGRIELAARMRGGRAAITVRDTGIGIPMDKLDAVFEPFVQVRADLARTAEGTGLGLAISRDLARGMGGDLTVESTLDVGSTFTVELPLS